MYRTKTRRNKNTNISTKKKYKTRVVIIILFRDALFRNILLISRDYRRCYYVIRGTLCPEIRSIQCDQSRRCSRLRETKTYSATTYTLYTCRGETSVKRIKKKKTRVAIRSIDSQGERITGGNFEDRDFFGGGSTNWKERRRKEKDHLASLGRSKKKKKKKKTRTHSFHSHKEQKIVC